VQVFNDVSILVAGGANPIRNAGDRPNPNQGQGLRLWGQQPEHQRVPEQEQHMAVPVLCSPVKTPRLSNSRQELLIT